MANDDGSKEPGFSDAADGAGLADAAKAGLASVPDQVGDGDGGIQLEGMDYGKVKFVGVQYDTLEALPAINDEVAFLVKGKVVGEGRDAMKDGHIRTFRKVEVSSVTPYEAPAGG